MKKILVTGGLGFIGQNLSNKLHELGYDVTVFDKPRKDTSCLNNDIKYMHGFLNIRQDVERVVRGADCIVHLGAKARIPESDKNPEEYYRSNVSGTNNVINAARKFNVNRIIYAGSSTYYGNQPTPHSPDMPPQPLNYYAVTKEIGESLCRHTPMKVDTTIMRLFTVYGPGQPLSKGDALVIGNFLRQTQEGKPLTIDGDGEQTRDFIHVSDVVDAFIAAIKSEHTNTTFNVGSGKAISIKDLAKLFSDNVVHGPARSKYALHTLADISKTTELLGWTPKISIEEGITRMLRGRT